VARTFGSFETPEQTFNRLSLDLHIRQLGSIRDWLIECHHAFEINF